MAKKVYAIKEGFNFKENVQVKNIIVNTWSECLEFTKGVKGAKYKSFESLEEAENFLSEPSKMLKKGVDTYPLDCLHIYVDGSYYEPTNHYSYGLVAVKDNVVQYMEGNKKPSNPNNNIRQIAGELLAALKGVQYALQNNESKVVIFHDYEGISHHATGYWERRDESSRYYHKMMNALMDKGIEVIFVKVDSHTGDFYNEMADEICKYHLDIPSDKIVDKWLKTNTLKVSTEEIKTMVGEICSVRTTNITVNSNSSILKNSTVTTKELLEKEILNKLSNATIEEMQEIIKILER